MNQNYPYYYHICKTPAFVPDVNECDVQSPCQHHCYNLIGSFLCQCDQGYELAQDSVSCQGGHTHTHTGTHTHIHIYTVVDKCMYVNTHHIPIFSTCSASYSLSVCVWISSVQTLMNAASPATCVSTSVSTAQEVTPVSVQRDISSRETGCVKVLQSSFFLSLFHLSIFSFYSLFIYLSYPPLCFNTQQSSQVSPLLSHPFFLFLNSFEDNSSEELDRSGYRPLFYHSSGNESHSQAVLSWKECRG